MNTKADWEKSRDEAMAQYNANSKEHGFLADWARIMTEHDSRIRKIMNGLWWKAFLVGAIVAGAWGFGIGMVVGRWFI